MINNKIGGRNMVGRAVNRLAGRLTAVALTAAMAVSMLAGCAAGGKNTETAAKKEYKPSAMEQMNAKNDPNVIQDNYRTCYEVFVYSFFDSDGDGIGDLKGLTEKLDYIEGLGCNEIWMMPIMPSPSYHKYDITDYMNIDKQYGTLDDFDALITECHKRNINVIIDFVINHTSNEHPWFKAAADYIKSLPDGTEPDSSECPYVDYYNFSKTNAGGYNQLPGTNWYYESQFVDSMPDLNLQSEAVRGEIDKVTSFWLDRGVDGFRLDAVLYYNNNNQTETIDDLTWLVNNVKSKKADAYMVGEGWTTYREYAKYYKSGIDSMFNFDFSQQDGYIGKVLNGTANHGASTYGNALVDVENEIKKYTDSYIDAPFYTNHDMGRSAGYYNGDNAEEKTKMAQAMNLLMPGNAFLYYGEEIGMRGTANDETKRLAMRWSGDSKAKGMCVGPQNAEETEQTYDTLDKQMDDPYSIYNFVKQTISIRNAFPEIARGTNTFEKDLSNDNVCIFTREYNGEKAVLIFNPSKDEASVDVSSLGVNDAVAMLQTTKKAPSYKDGTAKLPAYSVLVLK